MNHQFTILVCLAYIMGSISSASLISKAFSLSDPRSSGSNNPGATNVMRIGGKLPAALTLLADASKGFLPVIITLWLGYNSADAATVGCGAIFGHLYPIFYKFNGGKGVATTLGICLALNPWFGLVLLTLWITIAKLTKISSLAAICCCLFAPIFAYAILDNNVIWIIACISLSVLIKHHANIQRLVRGKEAKI